MKNKYSVNFTELELLVKRVDTSPVLVCLSSTNNSIYLLYYLPIIDHL